MLFLRRIVLCFSLASAKDMDASDQINQDFLKE
jgi:hypothetical protein